MLLVLLARSATAHAAVDVGSLAPGTDKLRNEGRQSCGNYRGYVSVKACGSANIVDLWWAVPPPT